jgi:hypothetical protein
METWRDKIVEQFVPKISKLSLVSDPDNLITEEKMAVILRNRGFDILEFNDAIEFRYAYESQYRTIWDKGLQTELVVIIHTQESKLDHLPYDLLEKGKKFYFSIAEIFPVFSPSILGLLDKSFLDTLYSSRSNFPKDKQSDYSTIDFLLRYIYKVDVNAIDNEMDLINSLLLIHYNNLELPLSYLDRLEYLLTEKKIFSSLPINKLLTNKDFFIEYLMEKHIEIIKNSPEVQLFQAINNGTDEINKLLEYLESMEIAEQLNYREWMNLAWKLANITSYIYRNNNSNYFKRLESVYNKINELYEKWLVISYSALRTIPPITPAMVHHIPHYLAYHYRHNNSPIALIVIDGLALNQWITLRDSLPLKNIRFIENALIAWIPTVTSISRQSIFSGKDPYEYEGWINTTEKEEKHWSLFWENNGVVKQNIVFMKGLDSDNKIKEVEDKLLQNKAIVMGLVMNKIDNIMHGMEMGMAGFHGQIKLYGENGQLSELISSLIENHFEIWITSDHGNTECIGRGQPHEGSNVKSRGERVRIYKSESILESVRKKYTWTNYWKPIGLPKDYLPLIAKGNNAFLPENNFAISHGSISMQETIVPFIKVLRK